MIIKQIIPNLPHNEDLNIDYIPLSALDGDNILTNSEKAPWYVKVNL